MSKPLSGFPGRFRLTLSLGLLLATSVAWADRVRVLVQRSPLAGAQFHELAAVSPLLKLGEPLVLVREPANRHDPRAVRVEWQGRMLGYVPRAENRAVATAMDGGERLSARVVRLSDDSNPWRRVEFEIYLDF